MSQVTLSNQSTWASKLKAMGPGILMASAAVGGSHIVSSTQAGGSYGWSLAKPWWKAMLKKENSISGFSLSSMSFQLWSTQLVLPFCAQLSSPVPSQ